MNLRGTWHEIMNKIVEIALQFVPWPPRGNADIFAKARQENLAAQRIALDCAEAIEHAGKHGTAKFLAEHARRMLASEDQRQSSVIGRAQGLFVILAVLTSLTTVGASIVTTTVPINPAELVVVAVGALCILLQILLLVFNVVRAIEGLEYRKAGSSDVARWARASSVGDVYRNEAIVTLEWYRDASHKNTWRFYCLARAMLALRNIIILVCFFIAVFLAFGIFQPPSRCTDETAFPAKGPPEYSVRCATDRGMHHWLSRTT